MIKSLRNKEKGVTLISLTVTIVILSIIVGTIVYNSKNETLVKQIDYLYSDINSIENKINTYYLNYGEIPVICTYLSQDDLISLIKSNASSRGASLVDSENIVNPNDDDTYYVIDLEQLEGLSLNYGYDDDYNSIKINERYTSTEVEDEIYIINNLTHQIYYPRGIYVDDVMYYTDNAEEFCNIEFETTKPEYVETLAKLKSSGKIVKEDTTIIDENGDSITIPKGFNVASDSATEVIGGVVIEDSSDNQYVWIPVFEKSDEREWGVDYSSVESDTDYDNIEKALKVYTATYANSNYTDTWYGDENYGLYGYYDGDTFKYYSNGNMTKVAYEKLYNKMLRSVYMYGGFYIGRYEMGIDVVESVDEAESITRTTLKEYTATEEKIDNTTKNNTAPTIEGMSIPVSKANAVGYTYITQSQAQMLAQCIKYNKITGSLMFGVQWDAVCVFIEKYDSNNSAETKSEWLTNNSYSKLWGNYINSSFTMNRGFYSTNYNSTTVTWNEKFSTAKGTSTSCLCTTGASDQNCSLNIYDFAGNLYEFTLEMRNNSVLPCVYRGGNCYYEYNAFHRRYYYTYYYLGYASARVTFWL